MTARTTLALSCVLSGTLADAAARMCMTQLQHQVWKYLPPGRRRRLAWRPEATARKVDRCRNVLRVQHRRPQDSRRCRNKSPDNILPTGRQSSSDRLTR